MNITQYFLMKLSEESHEVGQIALKTAQFGMDEVYPELGVSNAVRVHQELDDLWAVVEELNERCGLGYIPSRDNIEKKKQKMQIYASYSQSLNLLEKQ